MEVPGAVSSGAGLLAAGPRCLQPHACAGATSQRSCSSQRPLTARAPVPPPCLPPGASGPRFLLLQAPPQAVFSDPLDSWSFICSSYIIWDLVYVPEILSERDRGFHGFWRRQLSADGKGAQGPPRSPTESIALTPLGVSGR